jgi:hypothetical protein
MNREMLVLIEPCLIVSITGILQVGSEGGEGKGKEGKEGGRGKGGEG